MSKMSDDSKYEIELACKDWLQRENYSYIDELPYQEKLDHFEIRAALYDFFTKGDEKYSASVENSKTFRLIFNGEIHKISKKDFTLLLDELRNISGYGLRQKMNSGGLACHDPQKPHEKTPNLTTLHPLRWAHIDQYNRTKKEMYPDSDIYGEIDFSQLSETLKTAYSFPDVDIGNGLLTVSIRLECDNRLIIKELEELLDFWRAKQQGVVLQEKGASKDPKYIKSSNISYTLMLCDLLLWCEVKGYARPNNPQINKLAFKGSTENTKIRDTHLPRATRLLSWVHIIHLRTQY